MKLKSITSLLLIILPFWAFSQGSISGTITDASSGETLIGVNIVIEGTAIGSSTDFDGKYQFQADPGVYTVVASYIGYADKKVSEVEVKENEVTYLDVSMSDGAVELDLEVVVTAKVIERSENSILMLQRKSDKIQDGISSQEMSRFSVSDAAGALKKVTGANVEGGKFVFIRGLGDRYSLTQLNDLVIPSTDPYRNSAQLDLIPANLVENIITTKTFTPDQPGYFTGGNINIKTKSFPEQFSLTFSVSGAFNPQNNLVDNFPTHRGGNSDYWGYDDGRRDLASVATDAKFNQFMTTDAARNARRGDAEAAEALDITSKTFERQVAPNTKSSPLDHGFSIAFGNQYNVFNKPLGVILSTSFKQSYSFLEDFTTANWRVFNLDDDELFNQGDFVDNRSTENPRLNGLVGLAYKLSDLNSISFNFIYNHNTEKTSGFISGERPDNITLIDDLLLEGKELSFIERELVNYQLSGEHVIAGMNNAKIEWKGSIVNSSQYEPQTRFFENSFNVETGSRLTGSNDLNVPVYFFRDLEDSQYIGKLDLTFPFNGNSGNKFKFGGLYTTKDRDFIQQTFELRTADAAARFRNFAPDFDAWMADGNLGIIGVNQGEAPGGADEYLIGNFFTDETIPIDAYSGNETITAFYGMVTYNFGEKLKAVAGARVEITDILVETDLPEPVEDIIGEIDGTDVLPSLGLTYALSEEMNLRFAFSQTLARPNMREIAPFSVLDPIRGIRLTGNPEVTKSNITNLDLRWEWFNRPGEIYAISGYYKSFDDPIIETLLPSGNIREIQYDNVESAELFGVEFEIRKDLDFIAPWLENVKFSSNISFINSTSDVDDPSPFAPSSRPFTGQPEAIYNMALIYSNIDNGWDASLAYNRVGDRLESIGFGGTPDIFTRARDQLDLTLIKRINNINLKFSAQNLTNAAFNSSSTFKGNEFVYSKFRRGVRIGLGVSYTVR